MQAKYTTRCTDTQCLGIRPGDAITRDGSGWMHADHDHRYGRRITAGEQVRAQAAARRLEDEAAVMRQRVAISKPAGAARGRGIIRDLQARADRMYAIAVATGDDRAWGNAVGAREAVQEAEAYMQEERFIRAAAPRF